MTTYGLGTAAIHPDHIRCHEVSVAACTQKRPAITGATRMPGTRGTSGQSCTYNHGFRAAGSNCCRTSSLMGRTTAREVAAALGHRARRARKSWSPPGSSAWTTSRSAATTPLRSHATQIDPERGLHRAHRVAAAAVAHRGIRVARSRAGVPCPRPICVRRGANRISLTLLTIPCSPTTPPQHRTTSARPVPSGCW